ncbi:unnamed protein product [Sphagnum jensenii]|uniref:Uncharacterized protein n=1 Tax=Sphagnum jensenii TaxID=128206 RepID=A0ABP1BXF1_9BRYO
MGKWVCYICLLPLKSFLGCFSQIPMTKQVERPVCEVDLVLWQLLQWHRRIAAQGMINRFSPAEPQTFHQLRAELAAIWSPHKDWRHLWRITKWAK